MTVLLQLTTIRSKSSGFQFLKNEQKKRLVNRETLDPCLSKHARLKVHSGDLRVAGSKELQRVPQCDLYWLGVTLVSKHKVNITRSQSTKSWTTGASCEMDCSVMTAETSTFKKTKTHQDWPRRVSSSSPNGSKSKATFLHTKGRLNRWFAPCAFVPIILKPVPLKLDCLDSVLASLVGRLTCRTDATGAS